MITFMSSHAYTHYILLFLYGIVSCQRGSLCYIYGQETVISKDRIFFGCLYNSIDVLTVIVYCVLLYYVSKDIQVALIFFNVLVGLATYITFKMPETPVYLLSRGKYNRAKDVFNQIARINHKPNLPN
jgi:hypothetical protein